MVNVPVITKRELNGYFLSPIAYVVLAAFTLAQGIGFVLMLGGTAALDLDAMTQRIFTFPFELLLLAVPILTMRLLSEEARSGTLETLMTAPTTDAEVALGKFTGALVFAVILFLPLAGQVAFLRMLGALDAGALLAGTLGLLMLTAQFTAIGLFCSAMTRAQIASAIISLVVLIGLHSLKYLAMVSGPSLGPVLRYLSPVTHYVGFVRGVVDSRDLAYFVITTAAFLFLTVKALELRKWR